MATANNHIRFNAFPIYNSITKQYRHKKGVDFNDNSTFISPTFNFALPSFMLKIPATSGAIAGFYIYNLDGTVYRMLEIDNVQRVTYNDAGTYYDVITYYGNVLLDSSLDVEILDCGKYYTGILIDGNVYYSDLFEVYDTYAVSEEDLITNGSFAFDLTGWNYNTLYVGYASGQAVIEGSAASNVLRQNINPEPAPFQYKLTLDITLDPTIELRVLIYNGATLQRSFIYVASGVYTEILDNPGQIRFETSVFSGGDYAYINEVSIKKITTIPCFNRFVWGNSCTLNGQPYKIEVGGVNRMFYQTAMFSALVSAPKFTHEVDESKNELGVLTKNYDSTERRITVLAAPVPQFIVDAFQLLPLHSSVTFIDINNVELTPDFAEANEPEQLVENVYFTQPIELVDVAIANANCCETVSIATCPDELFEIEIVATYEVDDNKYVVVVNPTAPVSGFENALFQLYYTNVSLFADCPASPPAGYTAGGTFTQDDLNLGAITYLVTPNARKWCFRLRVSMPQCPALDNDFTNADSFNANIPV